jgi:alkylation response protein AidB-like acyl-CoA dehydrogenase
MSKVEERVESPFTLPADIRELKDRARSFIEREVWPLEAEVARTDTFDRAAYLRVREKARAEGFWLNNMPKRLGGKDHSMLALVAIEEESGRATNGLGFAVADRGPRELVEMATEDQIERWVAPTLDGHEREAWAITEPEAGSDVSGILTTAEKRGSDWVINGEKWFITDADHSRYFIVLARTGDEQSLFFVSSDNPGVKITRLPRFMHDPYVSKHAEMTFENCRVADRDRVPASGDAGAKAWFTAERIFIAARSCGAAERLIELARKWSLERTAFGAPIADNQAVSFALADSLAELWAARLMTYAVAADFDRGVDPRIIHGKAAMAKLFGSEMIARVADRTLQIFGGRGFMQEHVANRYYREVRVDRIWEGTSEIQRVVIGRGLLKRGPAPYVR